MFDERHLQLTSAYTRASQHFIREFIYPLGEFIYQSIKEAIDLKCRIEIGEETYLLTPDEDGGWKWSKGEEITHEEVEQIEESLAYLLPKLLSGGTDITPTNFPRPPDLPPVLPTPNFPPTLPPSGTFVEFLTIVVESNNNLEYQSSIGNDYVTREGEFKDISLTSSAEIIDDSSNVKDDFVQRNDSFREDYEQIEVDEHLTVELIDKHTIPTSSEKPKPQNILDIPAHPEHIDPQHWHELVVGSAIAPAIAEMNFESLHFNQPKGSHEAWDRLMISDELPRTNTGRLSSKMLKTYSYLDSTDGWWCKAGVDPREFESLTPGETVPHKEWGCYKPNQPRPKRGEQGQIIEGKFIKYEHPPKTQLSIFLLDVSDDIANEIYQRASVDPTSRDHASGFWYCVWKHNIPITITEGAKKAASLLSQGHAAIGLPGISAGYRSPKNEWGQKIGDSYLASELAVFATPNREIKICFDYETKRETKLNIQRDIWKTGSLLQEFGAAVKVVTLPGPDKGVDDFIVSQGKEAFEKLSAGAISLEQWHQNQLDDLYFTIKLKDGTVKTISEQGNSTMTDAPELEPNIGIFKKKRAKSPIDPSSQIVDIKITGSEIIHIDVTPDETVQLIEPPATPQKTSGTSSWAKKENVTLYEPNFFRKRLEASENKQIAFAAYTLLKTYGVEAQDEQQQTSSKIYHADAFVIKNHGDDKYSIYRRHDDVELMTFQADRWGHVGNIKLSHIEKEINILTIERQEFLLVADYLKAGKQLPSVDSDPRKIASILSSVSPKGTHNVLQSFKESEVLQFLTQTITSFEKDDITLDNYRILFQQGSGGKSTLQLIKTEHNGSTREAVRFEFERTEHGMNHQVQAMAITEADLEKLRLLAQKLHINYKVLFGNPTQTRDLDLPLHPEITRNLDSWQPYQSTNLPDNKTQSHPQRASSNSPKQQNNLSHPTTLTPKSTTQSQSTKQQNYSSNLDNVVLPLHPILKQYWEQLEKDGSWNEVAKQNHGEFQSKIQQTGELTVGEQRELYQKIQNQAWSQINDHGRTDIVLPPLTHIVNDLRSLSAQQPQQLLCSDPARDTPLPLHPDIASHWHNLEANSTWSSVANQYNNPLRQKLSTNGKLTIGEQRELYQKILLQSLFEQHSKGKTDISLPPLSDIVQDLINTRNQIINDTYSPKVVVHSQPQKSHKPRQPTTNSPELEL